ncbi:hypothetical protein ACTXT7_002139 [Hymenolepis weldensis]
MDVNLGMSVRTVTMLGKHGGGRRERKIGCIAPRRTVNSRRRISGIGLLCFYRRLSLEVVVAFFKQKILQKGENMACSFHMKINKLPNREGNAKLKKITSVISYPNSASSIDQDLQTGATCSVSVESIRPISGLSDEDLGHRMDQEDVDINKEPWFHGVLPRTEVVRLLQNQGDFLVRETSKAASTSYLARHGRRHRGGTDAPSLNNLWASSANTGATIGSPSSASTMSLLAGSQSTEDLRSNGVGSSNGKVVVTKMVLSVYWNGHKHFFIQGGNEATEESGDLGNRRGGWSFEEYEFPTLRDLIEYHVRTGKPVTQSSGAILLNPISRPDWQLDNRDVILLEKIGQGNFGEVHRGIYNGREVAVKTCRAGPAEVEIRRKFLQGEATALNFFHPNVVRLLGIAVRSHPIMIVMEYVAGELRL